MILTLQELLNLLEILKELDQKVQAVFITTDKVYENLELGIPFVETDKLGGKDPYSASKAASEILIDSYNKSFFKDSNINCNCKSRKCYWRW